MNKPRLLAVSFVSSSHFWVKGRTRPSPTLLALVAILAQSFFTFVSRHLVSCLLFSVRHTYYVFGVNYVSCLILFLSGDIRDGVCKLLRGFEEDHLVCRYENSGVAHQVSASFRSALFQVERAEVAEVDRFACHQRLLYGIDVVLNDTRNRISVHTRVSGD